MNFKELHAKFADDDSPTVEGQIRWLQKQGFAPHHIEQAMMGLYISIERGEKTFTNGKELDKHLLDLAKGVRTEELSAQVAKMEEFVKAMQEKTIEDYKKAQAKPWYRRIWGA